MKTKRETFPNIDTSKYNIDKNGNIIRNETYKNVSVSIKTRPDNCLKLFFLLQEQKSFKYKIILRIDFEDTYSLHFNYLIPLDIELYTRINVNALTESIKPHLIGELADVFTTYCIALSILAKELNNKNIGVYVSEEIEKLVLHKIKRRGEIYEKRKI